MKKTGIGRAVAFRLPARAHQGAGSFPLQEPLEGGHILSPKVSYLEFAIGTSYVHIVCVSCPRHNEFASRAERVAPTLI